METKHTKGHWEVEERGLAVFAKERFKSIAFDGQICRLHTGTKTYKNNEANAKLIACSPEMLEMLNKILIHVDFSYESWTSNDGLIIKEEIEELIKKATT